MPVIQTYNPLGEGLDAAASAIQGGNDARDKALALARAREQELYSRSEDAKRDKMTQDEFDERKDEFGQTHALDTQRTESEISHTQHQDKISDAVEATRAKMAPLLWQAQQLQLQVTKGQITQDQARTQGLLIANNTAKAQAALEAEFGKPMAEMALAQAQANYSSTQQATTFGALEEPGRVTAQNLQNTSTGLANQYAALQNKYAPQMFQNDLATARANVDKATDTNDDKDYKAQLSAATRHQADFDRNVASKKYRSDGKGGYVDPANNPVVRPPDPMSPTDFRASVSDEVDAIFDPSKRTDPDMPATMKTASPEEYANALIGQTNSNAALSVSQKREAILVIRSAMRRMKSGGLMSIPGGSGGSFDLGVGRGGSQGSSPFSSIVRDAASNYPDVPGLATVAHKVMGQESGGDTGAISNVGATGLMQLMPETARGLGVTNIKDPVQNIHGGVKYLAQLFRQFKSWPLALAAYNAGPGSVERDLARGGSGLGALNLPNADPRYIQHVMGQS